jgi:sulfur carrier protein ThiS
MTPYPVDVTHHKGDVAIPEMLVLSDAIEKTNISTRKVIIVVNFVAIAVTDYL